LAATVALTALNMAGTPRSRLLQVTLTLLTVAALAIVTVARLTHPGAAAASAPPAAGGSLGLARVFALLTSSGLNAAAYLAGEIRDPRRNMVRTLLIGTGAVMVLYLLANFAYISAFGLVGLAKADVVGAELMRLVAGDSGAVMLSLIVCVCALSTLNATI